MNEKRQPRQSGETIILGDVEYHIEGIEGIGGSTIVYRAFYEDRLNRGSIHRVLIKELFPWHPRGLIYRDESGCIGCCAEGKELFERSQKSFYLGNQANLELLEQMPEQISGNVNSFEAYGTYYSVLPLHGGRCLQEILEQEESFRTLREAAVAIMQMLDALDCFHRNGLLHLDISPDNILMLPTYVLLIDYNSVWPVDRKQGEPYLLSEKPGYSAPEIRLRQERNIGPAADLYSVSAVFFQMLTGRKMRDEDFQGRGIQKYFQKNLDIFQKEPASAACKAVQIVKKGLHVLARKRYQSAAAMKKDVAELIARIDGRGVTYSALWEGSLREQKKRQWEQQYLCRTISMEDGSTYTEEECFESLFDGNRILLKGLGGMGKTRFLMQLWEMGVREYKESQPITAYIPLADYQETGEEAHFIRKYLLRHICFSEETDTMEEALHELDALWEKESGQERRFILLLDGMNEAGLQTKYLLREIEELGKKKNLGILVTDRTESVKGYGLHGFQTAELLPLTEKTVAQQLAEAGTPYPKQEAAAALLTNPMMLFLYVQAGQMLVENGGEKKARSCPENMDDMIRDYLDNLYIRELRKDSGNQREQLRHQYIMKHLLPNIAGELRRRKKTLLTLEEIYRITGKDYQVMRGKSFGMAFPEFMGKSRLMLESVANESEWFDYAVTEQLIGYLGLLEKNEEGHYRLIHENFTGYLADQAGENRKKIEKYQRKFWSRKISIGILVLGGTAAAGVMAWRTKMPRRLSDEDKNVITAAMQRMEINLSICNIQLNAQNDILEEASERGVLEGDSRDIQDFITVADNKIKEAESGYGWYRDGKDHLEKLEQIKADIPVSVVKEVYQKPEKMQRFMEQGVETLTDRLCEEESVYDTYEKRSPLVEAYKEYLDAYTDVSYLEISQVICSLQETGADEAAEEIMETIGEMPAF